MVILEIHGGPQNGQEFIKTLLSQSLTQGDAILFLYNVHMFFKKYIQNILLF